MYDPGGIFRSGRWLVEATGPVPVSRLLPGTAAIISLLGLRLTHSVADPEMAFTVAFCAGVVMTTVVGKGSARRNSSLRASTATLVQVCLLLAVLGTLLSLQTVRACQVFTSLTFLFPAILYLWDVVTGTNSFGPMLLPGPSWDRLRRQMLWARGCQHLALTAAITYLAVMLTPVGWLGVWAVMPVIERYIDTAVAGAVTVWRDRQDP